MAKARKSAGDGWAALTWDDLERWAGGRSVERGRSYQRGGRVKDLAVAEDGALLATVVGTERYATTVALTAGGKRAKPDSSCTCPVGASGCKHAVAVVAEYLKALAEGRDVPAASEDDPRWAALEGEGDAFEEDEGWDDDDEGAWDEDDYAPKVKPRKSRPVSGPSDRVDWDAKIEGHLRSRSQEELADLAWSLVKRFPEVYKELRERLALRDGDSDRLVAEARREIRRVTAEPAWRSGWTGEGNSPDYGPIRHRFERLLELGHADEVVSLGREFLKRGLEQVGQSDDEGETLSDFAECLPVVFDAVAQSSLSPTERLLFAIDAVLADDFDAVDEAVAPILDADYDPDAWSEVAEVLTRRLAAEPPVKGDDSFSRKYRRDGITTWIATALREAGREKEVSTLYEAEARATGSYERLVAMLIEGGRLDEAERWAREGIAATIDDYPGIADHLAASLCELARKRKRWDVVAAHAARRFFEHPSAHGFGELIEAAKKAGVEEDVREGALRFLETGAMPFRVVAARPKAAPAPRGKSKAKGRAAARTTGPPSDRVTIDPAWPLPVPDYLVPIVARFGRLDGSARPHLGVLLEMAIAAKRPDEVLHWFDRMRAEGKGQAPYYNRAPAYADRVAAAVAPTHPDRAMEVYRVGLDAQLPHAQVSAYEAAVGYLKKLRPIYKALGRAEEWPTLVAAIREKYRNRPRFMELLDSLEGRTIVQSARARRK